MALSTNETVAQRVARERAAQGLPADPAETVAARIARIARCAVTEGKAA